MSLLRNHRAEALERELARMEKAHAEELKRAITEIERLRDENQRLVLAMHPVIQTVELPKEREAREERESNAPPKVLPPTGTPWQRVQANWAREQEELAKSATQKLMEKAAAAQTAPAKGESDGSPS